MPQNLYLLNEPTKWRAGFIGDERKEFFFDCGYCEAKEPVIVGFVASEPSFEAIAVLKINGAGFTKLALICEACLDAQKERLLTPATIPVNQKKCSTCPFREGSPYDDLVDDLTELAKVNKARICHNTGEHAINHQTETPERLCRGARDVQIEYFDSKETTYVES